MVLIYSSEVVEGVSGTYIAPHFFKENALEKATKVYAKDDKILKAYSDKEIEVVDLRKKTTKK